MEKRDRTGIGTLSIFGHQMRFDLGDGFPLVTTKKLHVKSIIYELLWFLRGDTNVKYLNEHGVTHLGRVGRRERRSRPGLRPAMALLAGAGRNVNRPDEGCGRNHRAQSEFAPADRHGLEPGRRAEDGAAAMPLLVSVQRRRRRLSCQLYQRSADVFLGVPFNIASYALLTLAVAQVTGLKPGDFIHSFGDAHLYLNHLDQARLQLSRAPRALPKLTINPAAKDLFALRYEDFLLEGYDPHPHIKAAVAV